MVARFVRSLMIPVGVVVPLGLMTAACDQQNQPVQAGYVQTAASGYRGEAGRVVAIHDVAIRGKNGVNDGTLVGGGVGAAGGAIAGGAISHSVGGAVVGGVLGAVAGGITGTAIDQQRGQRGIEVTVQRDDGQQVTIAQTDNGDIQMGDRVMIVYDRNGVPRAVRDQSRGPDRTTYSSYN